MGKVKDVFNKGAMTWKISSQDHGKVKELQDLGSELGVNLSRVNNGINGRHVACEFGFGSMYSSEKSNANIVDNNPSCSVELTLIGMAKIKAPIHQISIHKAGAHARIVLKESDIKVTSGTL